MKPLSSLRTRRLWATAAVAALSVLLSGCAGSSSSTHHHAGGQVSGVDAADSNNDGAYVQANGITYQLEVSRQLNPFSSEDSAYVKGLPAGMAQPTGDQLWYGVFLWAKNQWNRPYRTATNFAIEDTQGDHYYPIKLSLAENPFAYAPTVLSPQQTDPGENTVASQGFNDGRLLLFKLPTSVYSNRPLTLYIEDGQRRHIASISLDL